MQNQTDEKTSDNLEKQRDEAPVGGKPDSQGASPLLREL